MKAEIISVNSIGSDDQFIKHELDAFGISSVRLTKAVCEETPLREALRHALSKSELVVITGAYSDSFLMRKVVADVLGAPLELHEDSWERIREFHQNTSKELEPDAQNHAMMPRGSTVFPNDHGCTPGCAVSRYGQHVLILPGTAGELIPMFSDYVAPYLTILTDGTIVSRTVGVFGLSEAVLTERLADLMSEANPSVVSYAKDGEAILRVTARAADRKSALALCNPVVEEIRKRLSVNVYGVDVGSLQKAVVALLLDKNMKIATAESCTAGLLSSRLTEVTGVSAVFECGIAAYSPEIKHSVLGVPTELIEKFGTVSPEVAGAMADGVRRVGKTSLGVGITGVAGPDTSEGKPVGTVYIAIADEKRVWVKKISTALLSSGDGEPDRDSVRALATTHALDLVRRYLEALPTVMAGGEIINPQQQAASIPESRVEDDGNETKARGIKRALSLLIPWKGDRKIDVARKLTLLLSIFILIGVSTSIFYFRILQPLENQKLFSTLRGLYETSQPFVQINSNIDYPEGMLTQFYALYARNPDVRGWVKIEDTNINYPVMLDRSNGYYKNRNFDRQPSHYGVPYFSKDTSFISPLSVNRSMVIYGNNNRDGQMFSDLTLYYNNIDFLRRHPVIEMNTIYKNAKWKVFSVMVLTEPTHDNDSFDYTRSVFTDEIDFLRFAGELKIRSLYNIPPGTVDVQEGDSLLLLSTDFESTADYNGARLVVAARKVRSDEPETVNLSGASYNSNVIMPPEWKKRRPTRADNAYTTSTLSPSTYTSDEDDETTSPSSETSTEPSATVTTRTPTTTESEYSEPQGPTDSEPDTTTEPTNTTTSAAVTTTTTTTTAPPTTAPPPQEYEAPPILAGSADETEFLSYCKAKYGDEVIQPKNKSELQMLLARIVKNELGHSYTMENDLAAQKAQAIASYTYILYYNKTNKTPCPVSMKPIDLTIGTDKKIYDAVDEVVGIKILEKGSPICAVYSASTPGHTANNHEVYRYGKNLKYLYSVPSVYEDQEHMPEIAKWNTEFTISMEELETKLEEKYGNIGFESGSAPFYVRKYDKNGQYVLETNAYYYKNGVKTYISGHEMRAAIGSTSLRSHAFKVISSTQTTLTLDVYGYGHGIGLSQWGAANYARYAGWDYKQILSHYYSITQTSDHRLVYPVW